MNPLVVDLVGKRFGNLTPISYEEGTRGSRTYTCLCDCGNARKAKAHALLSGQCKTCGCRLRYISRCEHGHAQKGKETSTYGSWEAMRQRCLNPRSKHYPNYGGRGIEICNRWNSFENFLEDMGNRPLGMTLERIDNDGNYEPGNCCWATRKQQQRNRRNNRLLTINCISRTLTEWCEVMGVSKNTVLARLARGWSAEKALSHPVRICHHRHE